MAYSRWSRSIWYTFWRYTENTEFQFPTQQLKDAQFFEICDFPSYDVSYAELDELGVDIVAENIRQFYSKDYDRSAFIGFGPDGKPKYDDIIYKAKNPTNEQIEELKGYLIMFMNDVDEHFKWKNFFKHEWYYPIRNRISRIFSKKTLF